MATPPKIEEATLREALQVLMDVEQLIVSVDRADVTRKLVALTDMVESLGRHQVDIRLLKVRIQALLSPNDPEKTPVHGISTDRLQAVRLPPPVRK